MNKSELSAPCKPQKPFLIPYTKGGLTGTIADIQDMSYEFVDRSTKMFESVSKGMQEKVKDMINALNLSPEKQVSNSQESIEMVNTSKKEKTDIELLNPRGRLDYMIQESVLENPYLSAIVAHMNYWGDYDLGSFLLKELNEINPNY